MSPPESATGRARESANAVHHRRAGADRAVQSGRCARAAALLQRTDSDRPGDGRTRSPAMWRAQTQRVIDNLAAILAAAGCSFDDVVKTTILLAIWPISRRSTPIYGERFGATPPARATFAVAALPMGARIEIEAVALDRGA